MTEKRVSLEGTGSGKEAEQEHTPTTPQPPIDFGKTLEEFQEKSHQVLLQFRAAIEFVRPMLEAIAKIDWNDLRSKMDTLRPRSKKAMRLAAKQGWFWGWNGSLEDVFKIIEGIEGLNASEIDDFLSRYHRDNLIHYYSDLTRCYPHRENVIKAALEAHNLGTQSGYLLSIPVLLAQADGILSEVTETESALQKSRKNKDQMRAADWLRGKLKGDPESLDLVDPILNLHANDLFKSARQRSSVGGINEEIFSALNRHQIMHGEISNYGTEMNSLKAFSFLTFVGLHLPGILKSAAESESTQDKVASAPQS